MSLSPSTTHRFGPKRNTTTPFLNKTKCRRVGTVCYVSTCTNFLETSPSRNLMCVTNIIDKRCKEFPRYGISVLQAGGPGGLKIVFPLKTTLQRYIYKVYTKSFQLYMRRSKAKWTIPFLFFYEKSSTR